MHHKRDQPVYLALGANIGHRVIGLLTAVRTLQSRPGITVARVSPFYSSPAHVLPGQKEVPPFINCVVEVMTFLTPEALWETCEDIERAGGRRRSQWMKWLPRTLDIDILLYCNLSVQTADLQIPHPGLPERRFVLQPLSDLAPELFIPPPISRPVADLLRDCADLTPVNRLPLRREVVEMFAPNRIFV